MSRIRRILDSIGRSRARTAIAGTAAVASVVAGAVLALALSDLRDQPTAHAEMSDAPPVAETSPSATASPTPSAKPTPTPSPSPSAASAPSAPSAASSTPSASVAPTPEAGGGGLSGPTYDVTGTWESLPRMPGGSDFLTADSLVMVDGTIVVFRWDRGGTPDRDVLVYDPEADTWTAPTFAGERPRIGTDQSFGLGSDGRIYTHDYVIDPTGAEWTVTPFALVRESDVWAGTTLTGGPDGRIYRSADDTSSERTQLIAYDPLTDTFERSSVVPGNYDIVISGGDSIVLFGSMDGDPQVIEYAPATGAWSAPHPVGNADVRRDHAALGPGGGIYLPGFQPDAPELWRFSLDDDSWSLVELPDDAVDWSVELLWGPDDRLYAFGPEQVWAFTPDD